ncbi:diguanylate cyclase (GGDEF) domain-containing protein [Rathayibacter oskolensis]|uniref:Diguanylate cyclase (GGDEF) domain-containing protein n=1 Tax=Rathayibacter oskolensis TaxID=1891671 RepID=A0A1X7PFD6_9MICO|nr:bifunctional diguanylate cyclase/phosphodiesterase [Rathayibacter oskolensis]SMH49472.1 diguanylate cyclase (GGDEF) domain-containing protein [Rathayibacter oskolensis]
MQRTHGLGPLDVVIAGLFGLLALGLIVNSTVLLLSAPPGSWAFVIAFGVAVALTASLRIELGRRSGMPTAGLTVTLLVVLQPGVDPLRLVGVWTAATLVAQLVQTRSPAVAAYVTGLGALAAIAYLVVFDALRAVVTAPVALLAATLVFLMIVLAVDFVRQRGRWSLDSTFGFSALVPSRLLLLVLLLWALATTIWFLDSVVVPAMADDPGIEQSPMLLLGIGALVFSVAKRIEVRRVRRRLAGVLDAALELPWGGASQAEGAIIAHARTSIEADRIEVRDEPASGSEIGSVMLLPDGRTRYVVASKRVSAVPFDTEDEQILDALAHMGTDTLGARDDVESLRRYVDRDPLTGLPNQRAFQKALAAYNRDRRPFEGIAVLFLDLDDFKDLNDGRGHHVGDKMLRLVGQRLGGITAEGGFAARIGGDEFVLILRGLHSADDARRRAEALIETVSASETVDGDTLAPVVSVGVAFSAHEERDPSTIVIEADRSMLALKRSRSRAGRERSSAIDVTSVLVDPLREAAARAVREGTLDLAFQPIVELATNRIWAFEALLRLDDPIVGSIPPAVLIPKVRELDLLDELTVQVVEKAMAAAESFRDTGVGVDCMTVNVDLEQLAPDRLGDRLAGVPARFPGIRLCVELNERSLDDATDELRAHAQRLRDVGVLIALDDYGAQGSSAVSIATFPLDIVKLDRALITDLATELRKREIVRAMQSYSVAVGVRVIVEGAEDAETIALLRELGVTDVQGYVFGRPDTRTGAEHRLLTTGSVAAHSLD